MSGNPSVKPVTVRHIENFPNSPAVQLAVRGWEYLLSKGWTDPGSMMVSFDHKAIVAFDGAEAIGVLTWMDQPWANQVSVVLAYVDPGYQRRGVHSQMFRALVHKARELRRPSILSTTAGVNKPARSAMNRQGRAEVGVIVRYDVPGMADA